MADNTADGNGYNTPGYMPTGGQSGDYVPPHDNQIPYTYTPLNTNLAYPGPGMPGHKRTFDPKVAAAQAAARYQADVDAANAKSAAQRRRDLAGAQPQHAPVVAKFTPAPKRGKR